MGYMRDYRSLRLDGLVAGRDLPNLLGWWDTSEGPFADLADGTEVLSWHDLSGYGWEMRKGSDATAAATKRTDSTSDLPVIRLPEGAYLRCAQFFDSNGWPDNTGVAQPVTLVCVAKLSSANTGSPVIFGGFDSSYALKLLGNTTKKVVNLRGTSTVSGEGAVVFDDAWHVMVAQYWATGCALFVDGHLVSGGVTQAAGTDGIRDVSVGNQAGLASDCLMDVAVCGVLGDRLRLDEVESLSRTLMAKWAPGTAVGKCAKNTSWEQTTSPNGQGVRIWTPPEPAAEKTLIVYCHQSSGSEQITPAFWSYGYAHMAINNGWWFAAGAFHGNNWGSDQAIADVDDLVDMLITRHGAFDNVILMGPSMGGPLVARLVKAGTIANTKGAILIDPAVNLRWVYDDGTALHNSDINTAFSVSAGTLSAGALAGATSVSSSVSFPSGTTIALSANDTTTYEIVTTTGAPSGSGPYTIPVPALAYAHDSGDQISDMPSKTATKDPVLLTGYPAIRWLFIASPDDTLIDKTQNADVLEAIVDDTALSSELVTHLGDHLGGAALDPARVKTFIDLCIA